jgi:hypothetical protein
MAKVGRAAYSASRARLEVVTAGKTISKNESGELYAVDAGGAVDIVLPTDPENGTRYSFWIIDDAAGAITITAAAADAFQGAVTWDDDDAAGDTDQIKADGVTTDDDVLTLAADTEQGSWVEVVYDKDNTRWLVQGFVSAATTPAFA